jgi:bifunctional polynucleotide phosphatase/kinase
MANSYALVSLDVLLTRKKEEAELVRLLKAGENICVDNTHMSVKERKRYLDFAKQYDYPVTCIEFTTEKHTCIARNIVRNKEREPKDRVPAVAIHVAAKRYEQPTLEEGFTCIYKVGG